MTITLQEALGLEQKRTQSTSQKEPMTIIEGDIKTQLSLKQVLLDKLIAQINLCEKKIASKKVLDKDKRAWMRLLIEAIRACGLLPQQIEAYSEHTETRKLIHLHMWMPKPPSDEVDIPTT